MKASASNADMARIEIIMATRADVADLVSLCAEHAAFERLPHDATARTDALADALDGSPPRLHAWLARSDGCAMGYASATTDFSTLDRATYLHMDCLYVQSPWRGRGIGLQLWQAVHAQARALGCRNLQWQTPAWNEPAARFYRKLQASEATKLRYVLPLCDA